MFRYFVTGTMVLLSGLSASAGTILFSNLVEPGGQYGFDAVGFGNTPGSSPEQRNRALAVQFSVAADSVLNTFQVPLDVRSGPNEVTAYLLSDALGVPGNVIETYQIMNLPSGPPTPLTVIPSASNPTLAGGEDYWFAVSAGELTFAGWTLTLFQGNASGSADFATGGVVGDPQSVWDFGPDGPGAREGTLVVSGEAVPEPGTMLLGALSLVIVLIFRKSRWAL